MKPMAIILATGLVFAAGTAHAQARVVSGRVFDDTTGCPLAKAQITVAGDKSARAVTNGQGRYTLANAPASPFTLQAWAPGYQAKHTDSVTVTDASARVDFSLLRSGSDNAKVHYPAARCHLEPANADNGGG